MKKKRLLVLDIDGTVRKGYSELGRFVNGPEDVEVFPSAVVQMRKWKNSDGRIIGVSNQGGIALGYCTMDQVSAAIYKTWKDTEELFDVILFCQHHPGAKDPEMAKCWCRKPAPGLVIQGALMISEKYDEIYPPYMALFVGDREEDKECARICSIDFMWAHEWRNKAPEFGKR